MDYLLKLYFIDSLELIMDRFFYKYYFKRKFRNKFMHKIYRTVKHKAKYNNNLAFKAFRTSR